MLGWMLFLLYIGIGALPIVLKKYSFKGRITWALLVAIIFVGARIGIEVATESLWYADLGYEQRYWNILIPEIGIFVVSFIIAVVFIMANFLYIFKTTSTISFFKYLATGG
jgi:uncharacterized membrane protein (UPF0182 family)